MKFNRYLAFALLFASSIACGEDTAAGADLTDDMPEDLPAGACRDTSIPEEGEECETDGSTSSDMASTSGGSTSGGSTGEDGCRSSDECTGQDVCTAEWDEQTQSRGPLACEFACIAELDDAKYCSDAAACCDANAVCTERGYCVVEDAGGSSSGGTGGSSSGGGE